MASDRQRDKERRRLPSSVYRDLKAASGGEVEQVATAYGAAGDALERGDAARAVQLLQGAKRRATRSAAVREALGIALYLQERFGEAARELSAYRRMSGSQDQNHLLADCARANGQLDRAEELVAEMMQADVPVDRVAEGLMVIAGARADRGEFDAALAALHRMDLEPRTVEAHHLRMWHLASDIERRRGDREAALGYLRAVATVEPDFLDVTEQLADADREDADRADADRTAADRIAADREDGGDQPGDAASKRLRQ